MVRIIAGFAAGGGSTSPRVLLVSSFPRGSEFLRHRKSAGAGGDIGTEAADCADSLIAMSLSSSRTARSTLTITAPHLKYE